MTEEQTLIAFENTPIRRHFDEATETWYFSIVDVIAVLSESVNPCDYWFRMKVRVKAEDGLELSTICRQLKLKSSDGKKYATDCANVEGLLRIIQSIPSPKAEPFKQWLAKVGYERIQDMADPALSVDRAREYWQQHGRSEKWIQQWMMGQETRNKLTDYWKEHEISKEDEYAILTNIIHQEWTGVSIKKHKDMKGLKTQNLRDHMSEAELIFTALAELSTRQIAESVDATGMKENADAGKKGGKIAKGARLELEQKTGKSVVSGENFFAPSKPAKKITGAREGGA
ncbi:BRO-N domain-containing protein [Pelodictyon phaeoclathratiforme]|uniref:Prophage antirepressor n=1 Tax=Pelodictyon phaeoclathratiforme (strain DSM 5477 / BU-1) TaxID=324925 RepID=B4SA05_PELPB|nr:Bro-N domain-containing protein [Pelodictyon phaeoclathratiforme]ACF43701.1 prophage antirepressor [Pelodictyon phaeoclathratiforme BU-1]